MSDKIKLSEKETFYLELLGILVPFGQSLETGGDSVTRSQADPRLDQDAPL